MNANDTIMRTVLKRKANQKEQKEKNEKSQARMRELMTAGEKVKHFKARARAQLKKEAGEG